MTASPPVTKPPIRLYRRKYKLVIYLLALFSCNAHGRNDGFGTQTNNDAPATPSAIDRRLTLEVMSRQNVFAITPHKPTYILPLSYQSDPNTTPFTDFNGNADHIEIKFQFSLKFPVWRNIFGDNGTLSLGYTQQSHWQAYNSVASSPFRETNHEPEAMLTFLTDYPILGFRNRAVVFGFAHQSNGRSGDLSRSWNRVYGNFVLERGNFYLSFRPWYRIPESAEDDDNADIESYLGYGDVMALYEFRNHEFGLTLRNNLRSENRGAVQLDATVPLKNKLKFYIQYFNGYGENLIDYNHSNSRVALGVMLINWL